MNYSISKIIPYVRRYVLLGIYDVLDGERVPYQKKEDTVVAKAEVYGNLSTFSISAEEQEMGTELKVTMLQSCVGLSEQGKRAGHDRCDGSNRTISGKRAFDE